MVDLDFMITDNDFIIECESFSIKDSEGKEFNSKQMEESLERFKTAIDRNETVRKIILGDVIK